MKKILLVGIVVLIAMFFVTCDGLFTEDDNVEYTDVVYSEDGSRVTVYLDGVGVPITPAQRAMSTRLSKMAYDYLEVIFTGDGTIARAQWELGQAAGISGVVRGLNYAWNASKTAAGPVALMAVGRKDGKTLLGIGDIWEVDAETGLVGTRPTDATIATGTRSVTFYLTSVKTGLIADDPPDSDPDFPGQAALGSFGTDSGIASSYTKLGKSFYPTYPIDPEDDTIGTYTFGGAVEEYLGNLIFSGRLDVQPRYPRYLENGGYRQMTAAINLGTEITAPAVMTNNVVSITFEPKGAGVLSFYIEQRGVILLTSDPGTNAGELYPVSWRIRTGLGAELYSLDDGLSGGGCVLITLGKMDLEDWLEIYWEWIEDTVTP